MSALSAHPSSDAKRLQLNIDGDNLEEIHHIIDACVERKLPFDISIDVSELTRPELLDAWPFVKRVLASHAEVLMPETHSLLIIGSKSIAGSAPGGAGSPSDIENYLRACHVRCPLRCELR